MLRIVSNHAIYNSNKRNFSDFVVVVFSEYTKNLCYLLTHRSTSFVAYGWYILQEEEYIFLLFSVGNVNENNEITNRLCVSSNEILNVSVRYACTREVLVNRAEMDTKVAMWKLYMSTKGCFRLKLITPC